MVRDTILLTAKIQLERAGLTMRYIDKVETGAIQYIAVFL